MEPEDLRKRLEKTEDKLSIFTNLEILNQYDLYVDDIFELIKEFLKDEEKLKLLEYPIYQEYEIFMIKSIIDENIVLKVIDENNRKETIPHYSVLNIIHDLSDSTKKQILYDQDFIERHEIVDYELKDIIESLSEGEKEKILEEKELFIDKLQLKSWQISELIEKLSNEEVKMEMLKGYPIESYLKARIACTLNAQNSLKILKEEDFRRYEKIDILASIGVEHLSEFLTSNKEFYRESNIHPYQIVSILEPKEQKEFIEKLEGMYFALNEKREILATLDEEVKQSIDTTNFPEEFKSAIQIKAENSGNRIHVNLEGELEKYRGLDNLIRINPEQFTQEERNQFMKLCDICPNLQVINTLHKLVEIVSTGREYKQAEEWISSILGNLKPNYSDAQKLAIIDNCIGKKISYSPDFDTEAFDAYDNRALWKIICSGYGVCNGIAKVEQYILSRIGIESEMVTSEKHAFLKVKNIELPFANGEIKKGNTIVDPTWNLANHRFNGKPNNFCKSYEEIRKNDIDEEEKDHETHKNDKELEDATLNLDNESLRNLFKSVGLTNEKGEFPVKDLIEKSRFLDKYVASTPEENINKQFLLLSKTCPEFAKCQNSTMSILSNILLNHENLRFNKCVVNRVYDRKDKEKEATLFVYINSNELGKKFYFADKTEGKMMELLEEEFTKKFECYEEDLKRTNGIRPWEVIEQEKEKIDMSKDSGKIIAEEGEGR